MNVQERLEPHLDTPTTGRPRLRPRSPSERLEPGRAPEAPKTRRRRRVKETSGMGRLMRVLSGILTVAALVLIVTGGGLFALKRTVSADGPLAEDRTVIIHPGKGRLEIAALLEREGVISNRFAFIIAHLARYTMGERQELKAGEYRFEPAVSMGEVLDTIRSGQIHTYKVTFPEGWTSLQIVERLRQAPHLTGDIATIPGEGTLLPATYPYRKGDDRQAIVDRMAREQREFLADAWAKRAEGLPVSTPEEALILASIVEKETGQAEERERVAGVFTNRLRKGMRLQSDPTIIYGIVGGKGSLGRPILKSEIQQTTPYNTYRIDGLPPTPICNPGRDSIRAVLNPADTKDLYFVADGTGGHTFSETLAEHNKAVANWRQIERAQRQAAVAAATETAGPSMTPPVPRSAPETPPTRTAEGPPTGAIPVMNAGAGAAAAPGAQSGGVPLPSRKPQ